MVIPPLDLAACAAEPIRVPGAIQPHGWLVAFEAATDRVVAYSDNCEQLTGLAAGSAQTAALQAVVEALRPRMAAVAMGRAPASIGVTAIAGRELEATVHRAGSLAYLEFEPASLQGGTQAPIYSVARRFVPLIQKATSVVELLSWAATEMKALTGFGRCLVYAFDGDGHGDVLAERSDTGYDSYLGQRFPASDIPAQARDLYLLNHIRLIPDADYVPTGLFFADESWNARTLDLSFAQLRSVSPVHLEYMRNMGTLASMSVSIVVRERLWGLISCHDHLPRRLDFQTRVACEHVGQLLSLQIEAKEDNADVEMRHEQRNLTMQIVGRMGDGQATLQSLLAEPESLLKLARSSGAAVVFNEQCWTVGKTPSPEHLLALADWISERGGDVCHSENLATDAASIATDVENTAGLLAISLSRVHRHLVIWFRKEMPRSVRWAGEAAKQVHEDGRVHPRRSFKSWEEIVRGRCNPWAPSEIAGVLELRQSLLGIVLQRTQERTEAAGRLGQVTIARDLAEQADSAKTRFLAVLSHELRTPLSSISNAAELIRLNATIPEKFAGLVPMIKRNVALEIRLIDDLLDLSAISAGKLSLSIEPVDMHALVRQVVDMLTQDIVAKDLRLSIELSATPSQVMADPVRMQQVLWNILRNAVKFTPRSGRIQISSRLRGSDFVLTCTDSGIGIDADALLRIFKAFEQADAETSHRFGGLGLGMAIAMGVVKSHGGELEATSPGLGSGATFTLRLAAIRAERSEPADPQPALRAADR